VAIAATNSPQKQTIQSVAPAKPTTKANIKLSPHLIFAGSGSNLEITRLLAKEFSKSHPTKFKIDVPASIGSKAAIQAAADGAITVGMISRPLNEQEKKLGLTVVPYAQTASVFTAHPSVADNNITSAELIKIYKGTKNKWQDGQEIIVLTREEGDSSITLLEKKIPEFKEVFAQSNRDRRWTTLYKNQQMNSVLAKTPYAIGLADVGTLAAERLSSIKVLNFNSVAPTLENVANGKYPLIKSLAFVYHKQKLPPTPKLF
jgi:phosphate transport system substrate-binding protein